MDVHPPAHVARLAATHGLGRHELTRANADPFDKVVLAQVIASGTALTAAVYTWPSVPEGLRFPFFLSTFVALVLLAIAFVWLSPGLRVAYVFRDGLVWTRNGRPEAATWPQLRGVALADGCATVTTHDGRRVPIRLARVDGADAVHDRLARVLAAR
jgi:hypothetical protein